MPQTKTASALESFANLVVGFVISYLAAFIIFPLFGHNTSPLDNLGITICYTCITFVRSYVIRRFFNGRLHREKN